VADLFEVLLVDGRDRWHAGFVVDDEAETDVLLRDGRDVPLFASRPALEHFAQERGLQLLEDLPDEVDLDLGGWLSSGQPQPVEDDVSQLWHLLIDDPDASPALSGELLDEAYDDLMTDVPGWFDAHGPAARTGAGRGRPAAAVGPATGLTGP
jgi:hypothetical protein